MKVMAKLKETTSAEFLSLGRGSVECFKTLLVHIGDSVKPINSRKMIKSKCKVYE